MKCHVYGNKYYMVRMITCFDMQFEDDTINYFLGKFEWDHSGEWCVHCEFEVFHGK